MQFRAIRKVFRVVAEKGQETDGQDLLSRVGGLIVFLGLGVEASVFWNRGSSSDGVGRMITSVFIFSLL